MVTATEHEVIRQTVLDYFEGWFDGDAERMDRALHKDLVKRRAGDDLGRRTKQEMVELTARGLGKADGVERRIEVRVADVYGEIATAIVDSAVYHEYVHLVRTSDGWRIANALWVHTDS